MATKLQDWARKLLEDDPRSTAQAAGLLYVENLADDGYRRTRWGRGFSYRNHRGTTIRGVALRKRFERLVIPPAWEDVVIARERRAHLQAVGRDAAGRLQYIYHPSFRAAREAEKFRRVVAFGHMLPGIRARVARDLKREGLQRERVLAAVVRLLETTLVRMGNDEYARKNDSYGLTTLRKRHVESVREDIVTLNFSGKSNNDWHIEVDDPAVVETIVECLETPGYEIFKYVDQDDGKTDVTSDQVNAYLRDIAGAHVTGKDFRTWAGTILAACALEELQRVDPDVVDNKRMLRAIERVATKLGNTPAVCRTAYIHPLILSLRGDELQAFSRTLAFRAKNQLRDLHTLSPAEAAVLALLERRLHEECTRVARDSRRAVA